MGTECDGRIAGAVLGTFFSICILIALAYLFWRYYWKKRRGLHQQVELYTIQEPSDYKVPIWGGLDVTVPAKDIEKGGSFAFDNPGFIEEEQEQKAKKDGSGTGVIAGSGSGGMTPRDPEKGKQDPKVSVKGRRTSWSPFSVFSNVKHERKRAMDDTYIAEPEKILVALRGHDFTGLGFNICGNMRDGIFVKDVLHRGPASESGKIKAGDRIVNMTVSFRHMVFEDALTILSYASPYEVQLEIQKISEQMHVGQQKKASGSTHSSNAGERLCHPFYRSQSIDDLTQIGKASLNAKRAQLMGFLGKGKWEHGRLDSQMEETASQSGTLKSKVTGSLNEKLLTKAIGDDTKTVEIKYDKSETEVPRKVINLKVKPERVSKDREGKRGSRTEAKINEDSRCKGELCNNLKVVNAEVENVKPDGLKKTTESDLSVVSTPDESDKDITHIEKVDAGVEMSKFPKFGVRVLPDIYMKQSSSKSDSVEKAAAETYGVNILKADADTEKIGREEEKTEMIKSVHKENKPEKEVEKNDSHKKVSKEKPGLNMGIKLPKINVKHKSNDKNKKDNLKKDTSLSSEDEGDCGVSTEPVNSSSVTVTEGKIEKERNLKEQPDEIQVKRVGSESPEEKTKEKGKNFMSLGLKGLKELKGKIQNEVHRKKQDSSSSRDDEEEVKGVDNKVDKESESKNLIKNGNKNQDDTCSSSESNSDEEHKEKKHQKNKSKKEKEKESLDKEKTKSAEGTENIPTELPQEMMLAGITALYV